MKPERWRQIDQILKAALDEEEDRRAAFLDQACGEDRALRQKVEALLAAHRRGEDFLEEPALEMAAKGIAKDQIEALVGKQLGSYKILSFIAAGGMGEVYRARDTQLEREVAIKVLPAEFTQDPERLARFQREAKLLASLNHPNIAAIHGLEESDGIRFLVLELVEGETLAERVAKDPLPVEEALEVCRQIAEGLEAAHEKGVVHRDLKPANVKMTPEGRVKILDFGLAKAFEGQTPVTDISQSPTLTENLTKSGVILGTAAYMSPEQARGKQVDRRADVWAFGAVLYELLTEKKAFEGETITETIAAVLKSEPDWDALPSTTPWRIQELLRRCLTKEQQDRLSGISNVRVEIKLALTPPSTVPPTGGSRTSQPPLWRRTIPWSVALLMGVMAISVTLWRSPQQVPARTTKFAITPSQTAPLAEVPENDLAISADGRHVVYRTTTEKGFQFNLHSLDDLSDRPIPGTEGSTRGSPFFSPDGESVGFFAGGKLKKVSLSGGSPITLCEAGMLGGSGSWGPDDTIVFSAGDSAFIQLYRVSASGGEPEILNTPDRDKGETWHWGPQILPGGKTVLFTISLREGASQQIAALSLEKGEQKILIENGRQARYVETGHLIYEQAATGNLMGVRFDLATLEMTGDPVPVLQGVRKHLLAYVEYAISDDGTLVYVPEGVQRSHQHSLVWVDRDGKETPVTQEKKDYRVPRISPDGKLISLSVGDSAVVTHVWIYDLETESLSRLTFEEERNGAAVWSPDSKWLIFESGQVGEDDGMVRQPVDRSRPQERLTSTRETGGRQIPNSWSSDGRFVAFTESENIGIFSMEGDGEAEYIVASNAIECCAKFSPDSNWLAYVSNESGRNQVYVRPFPEPEVKWLISEEGVGGGQPVWSPDGRELFYRSGK